MTNRTAAIQIVRKLRHAGFQAFLAGGSVRDMILKRKARDYDVATNARPGQVVRLFRRTLKVGAKFGVVMVLTEAPSARKTGTSSSRKTSGDPALRQQVEVATFRSESGYTDGRHPGSVEFCDAKEDALRRDFTINGMFYDPIERRIIDYVGGRRDLKKGIIRTIGDPSQRFSEDYLRMLRAVRFATQLNFDIDRKTWQAICTHAPKIVNISAERIAAELEAILTNPDRKHGANLLLKSGLLMLIFANFCKKDVNFGIKVLENLPEKTDFPLILACLLSSISTTSAMQTLAALKISNYCLKHIRFLLGNRGQLLRVLTLGEFKLLLSNPYYDDLYQLHRAILKASDPSKLRLLLTVKKRANQQAGKDLRPKPILNGHQLIALGAPPGPVLGLLIRELYLAQLSEHFHTPGQASDWVIRWLNNHPYR